MVLAFENADSVDVRWLTGVGSVCPAGTLIMHCYPSRMIGPHVFGTNHLYLSGTVGYEAEGIVALLELLTTGAEA